MATSGRVLSGVANYTQFYFQWQLTGQNVGGNYSNINWQWGVTKNGGLTPTWYSNAIKSVSGYVNGALVFGGNTWSNITVGGDVQLLSGSMSIGHNGDGSKSFGISSTGWLYSYGNLSNSGSWDLPSIARNATVAYTSGNINDESNPYIVYDNPAGHNVTAYLEFPSLGGGAIASRSNYQSGGAWNLTTGERNTIRSLMANTNATTVRYVIYDTATGNWSFQDFTMSIVNANPTFTTIGYHDSNSSVVTVTGDDQSIVQTVSTINLDIASGDKAVANKGASMVSYTAIINAVPTNISYTGSTINTSLGNVNASTNQVLSVTATDSRGNTTTVQKTVNIIPYSAPTITGSGVREDGFGADTTINVSAAYPALVVASVEKNSVDNATGIGYKVWEVGDAEPGSYTDIASTYSGGNVTITTPPIETLDQSTEYNLKVKVTDVLQTVTHSSLIGVGRAAFRIGTDGLLYNENKRVYAGLDLYPVGSVLITSVNTNPDAILEGTWVATSTASQSLFGMTLYGWRRSA